MAPKNTPTTTDGQAEGGTTATVMQEPEGGWPADQYTGKGGSYVRDPSTGIRTPTPETAAALAAAAQAQ